MKKKILLIDNDTLLNKINEKVLTTAGIVKELHIASNGLEGLEYLQHRINKSYSMPDIIILDLDMPVMNGFQFLDEFLRLDFPSKSSIEIVIFTSSSSPKDKQKAQLRGVQNFIAKPYLLRGLMDIILRPKSDPVRLYANGKGMGKLTL